MAGEEATERSFRPGVALERPKTEPAEIVCAAAFYLTLVAQIVLAFVFFGVKNSDVGSLSEDGGSFTCGSGMVPLSDCGLRLGGGSSSGLDCVSDSLCQEMRECEARALLRGMASPWSRLLTASSTSANLWAFLEEHAYVPTVLFLAVLILSVVWLVLLQKAARPVIWGTIAADILGLVAVFVYMLVEYEEVNWMCIIFAVVGVAMAVLLRRKIDEAAVIMTWAMTALGSNLRLFLVCGGVTLLWGCYFALWVASLISLFFVKGGGGDGGRRAVRAADDGVGGEHALALARELLLGVVLFPQREARDPHAAGRGLVLRAARVGVILGPVHEVGLRAARRRQRHLLRDHGGGAAPPGLPQQQAPAHRRALRPPGVDPDLLAFALKQCIFTYTRFGLIAQAYTGEPFCGTARKVFELLRRRLGEAIICNYLGSRVMAWCTWVLSLGVAFATWAWAEDLQHLPSGGMLSEATTIVIIGLVLAYFISMPSVTLALLVVIEGFIGNINPGELRAVLNVVFASLFCGSITHIVLENVSHIVVNTMDIIFFCFAVESDNAMKQDRFATLYDNINKSVAPGCIPSDPGVAVGMPADQATAPGNNDLSGGAAQPQVVNVVGQPVPAGSA
eukprot:CAMPEP_0179237840 /NCGR_PEP_ID=MMETSP0797-20121207/14645_1 /TAXON_ID=47934 /ORGANISM="Dinophysis acuminata, Strain DAEP01" /LENGTH=619 /DNA_ID=CAMNT_0020945129 /DNA_START=229 /DNA_END=2089 /DNA_ORIENTATION=+